jgi:hypothetical protein
MPYLIWGEVRIILEFNEHYMKYRSPDGKLEGYVSTRNAIDKSEFKFLGETKLERIIYGVD